MRSTPTTTTTATSTAELKHPPTIPDMRSTWHSPILFLFGGLAAMLGLIAFSLLILACSYWRLTEAGGGSHDRNERDDVEKEDGGCKEKEEKVYEEKFLVVMAGNVNPTFIATRVFTRASCPNNEEIVKNEGKEEMTQMSSRETQLQEEEQ